LEAAQRRTTNDVYWHPGEGQDDYEDAFHFMRAKIDQMPRLLSPEPAPHQTQQTVVRAV
jgi:hypothetical protein